MSRTFELLKRGLELFATTIMSSYGSVPLYYVFLVGERGLSIKPLCHFETKDGRHNGRRQASPKEHLCHPLLATDRGAPV